MATGATVGVGQAVAFLEADIVVGAKAPLAFADKAAAVGVGGAEVIRAIPAVMAVADTASVDASGAVGVRRARSGLGIVDDIEITKLNSQFLGRDVTTDCLSFDLSNDKTPPTGGNPRTLDAAYRKTG